ncbi:MAG: helix-turn-helix domain-containing protein, partial [Gemmatimonadota bacterium]|nr:helix-turn-helix domain-containing protein [Gemmatimonadota bacterium]
MLPRPSPCRRARLGTAAASIHTGRYVNARGHRSYVHSAHARGYAGASLERILTSSGVTKGALYHHFKSKADLLHAVIDDTIRPMIAERWMKPLAGTDDPIRAMAESTRATMMDATPEELRCGCPLN